MINNGAVANTQKPNLVFFLLDDLGVKDLGCYGSVFHESPNIDSLSKEGVLFRNAYASHAVCGPSRTAIISGRSAPRLGLSQVGGDIRKVDLPWPRVLENNGYVNCFAGKWHMGGADSVLPAGFDVNISGCNVGQVSDYYFPYKKYENKAYGQDVKGMGDGKDGDYLTDAITDKVLAFIDEYKEQPFLVYFSFYQTHKPNIAASQGKKEDVAYFEKKLANTPSLDRNITREVQHGKSVAVETMTQSDANFAAQIKSVDDNVGRVLKKLKELELDENTIVIFTSDQGSLCSNHQGISTQKPYRLGKGWNFEGGLRVPLIIKNPKAKQVGSVNDSVTVSTDLYPTILELLGLDQEPEQHLDGISLIPALQGKELDFNRTFRWAFSKNHESGHRKSAAIRKGDYKLIHWYADSHSELYNVIEDIGENKNLVKNNPEMTDDLMKALLAPDYMEAYRAN